jgi:hypothetical protein
MRYRPAVLGWLVIAACGAAPAPSATVDPRPPPAGSATPPAGPGPKLQWNGRDFTSTGLPAIASDGSAIVIAHRDNDGGRGNPNLTLIERDRSDRDVHRLVVLTPNDFDHEDATQIAARFERAAAWLRERHDARRLVALTALTKPDALSDTAQGTGVTVRWTPSRLVIERAGAAPVVRTIPASWLARDRPECQGCTEMCHNEAFLGGAYVDLARSVALVIVSYHGTDICWEPSSQHHVIAW